MYILHKGAHRNFNKAQTGHGKKMLANTGLKRNDFNSNKIDSGNLSELLRNNEVLAGHFCNNYCHNYYKDLCEKGN